MKHVKKLFAAALATVLLAGCSTGDIGTTQNGTTVHTEVLATQMIATPTLSPMFLPGSGLQTQ